MRLVLDWDGTVTERDTLDLVLGEFGDPEIYERVEAELDAGTMTLNEVIAAEFLTVTTPLEEVVPWLLEHTRVRAGFAELAREHRPLVISSGFHELIEPVLEREGVLGDVELRANRLDPRADGWRVLLRVTEVCPHCGEPCKRADLPRRRGRLRGRRLLGLLRRGRGRPRLRDREPGPEARRAGRSVHAADGFSSARRSAVAPSRGAPCVSRSHFGVFASRALRMEARNSSSDSPARSQLFGQGRTSAS